MSVLAGVGSGPRILPMLPACDFSCGGLTLSLERVAAFFSYSRADSDFVVRLAADLKEANANVWLDQLDIIPGERWDRAIEDALKSSPRLIVILSPTSVASTNVMDEVSYALEEQKTVIPVVYKDCEIPFRLRRLQYVDFKHDYAQGLAELIKVLHGQQEGQPSVTVVAPAREEVVAKTAGGGSRVPDVQPEAPARRAQPAAPTVQSAAASKFPMATKAIIAVASTVLILALFSLWRSWMAPTNNPAEVIQKPPSEPPNPQPAVPAPNADSPKPTPAVDTTGAQRAAPKEKPRVADARVEPPKNPANPVPAKLTFEDGEQALQQHQFDKALRAFTVAADAGDNRAMNGLGNLYANGNGVTKDYRQAVQWYEKGAAAGSGAAMANLGELYEQGMGVAKDYQLARQWYEKGANAGNGHAMDGMGVIYHNGEGVARDYQVARRWYEKAIAAGDIHAMSNLAVLYSNGYGVPKDYDRARKLNEKAAAAGDTRAMDNLGVLYQNGFGVPKDYHQAREWFDKGAAKGGARAMTHLGNLYEEGLGVPQDYQQARQWYEKGAAAGNAQAMAHLGEMYEMGLGVSKDVQLARQWYEKAAGAGDGLAQKRLKSLHK